MPFATGLAAVMAVLGALGPTPALAATQASPVAGGDIRAQEWWLTGLQVTQAWQSSMGAGVTVAVVGTGVAAAQPDLAGDVTAGPDYSGSGRQPGKSYWGVNGTAAAAIIAGHGHGAGGASGLIGIAPAAKILSIRVTLEFNDPLNSDRAITRRLPNAIADGIMYAVDHGARVIDLPLDPGTLGLTGAGDPTAGGGSAAEQAAVAYALGKNVVLIAPAGDDGQGADIVNYPAAYSGVIAVGAVSRNGRLAPFSSRHSYVSLTAPGVDLIAAGPSDSYTRISSTSMASGIVAGVAALVLSKFPHLTVAQVTLALTESTAAATDGAADGAATGGVRAAERGDGLPPLPVRSADGAGYGVVDAARAIESAAIITTAERTVTPPSPGQRKLRRPPVASPRQQNDSALALVRDVVVGLCVLIAAMVVILLVMRSRRRRGGPTGGAAGRARAPGAHSRRADRRPVAEVPEQGEAAASLHQVAGQDPAATGGWAAPSSWQGGGIGEIADAPNTPSFRPVISSAPRGGMGPRSRSAATGGSAGPPWEPAPEPERMFGPLPAVTPISPPPELGPSIRLPGDMAGPAAPPAATPPMPDLASPAAFDFGSPSGLPEFATPSGLPDFGTPSGLPDFGTPPGLPDFGAPSGLPDFGNPSGLPDFGAPPGLPDFGVPAASRDFTIPPADPGPVTPPDGLDFRAGPELSAPVAGPELPTQESLGFAAAPVATDYAAPPADPTYIWDLAATDVFPVAGADPDAPAADPESPDTDPPDQAQEAGPG
jgi:serine protease